MVSARTLFCYSALSIAAAAQQTTPAQAFNDVRTQTPPVSVPATTVKPSLTPEMRGDIFMARKMYREAIEAYEDGDTGSAVIINKLGIAHHQMLDLDGAQKYYARAIKLDGKYSEAINNLGTVYYAKKSYRRAVGQYRKALKLSPNSASIYSNLGTAWFARKKYQQATEAYEKALSLDPDVFEHRNSHGVLLQERTVQERATFYYYMAKTYAKSGAVDRALVYMRKALEEGFKERNKFLEQPEFAGLQELQEFKDLLAMEHRVL
jgi:tetratricopeptide (TPR) repeat protein